MASSLFKRLAKVWSAAAGAARGAVVAPANPPRVDLAVFGKHPGWDDHIPDDVGLDTARLVEAKQRFYLQGIGGNIDGGTWDKLPESQRVAFGHAFAWRPEPKEGASAGDRQLLVGRLWHSSDGKGRERYPMVACAALTNAPRGFAQAEALPLVEALATECMAARTEGAVRTAVERTRETLRQRLSSPAAPASEAPAPAFIAAGSNGPSDHHSLNDSAPGDPTVGGGGGAAAPAPAGDTASAAPATSGHPSPLAFLADQPEMGPNHQGLLRFMYLIRQEMAAFTAGAARSGAWGGYGALRPQQARVPACDEDAAAAAVRWLEFLSSRLDDRAPIFVAVPVMTTHGAGWADLIVGEATATQLYCLRAAPEALPLSTEIPYNLPPEFVVVAEQEIDASRSADADRGR